MSLRSIRERKQEKLPNSKPTTVLEEAEDGVKLWNLSDARVQRITHRIGEIVALNCQLLLIVDF